MLFVKNSFSGYRGPLEMESHWIPRHQPWHARNGETSVCTKFRFDYNAPRVKYRGHNGHRRSRTRPVNPAFKASLCKRRKQKIYFPQLFHLFTVHPHSPSRPHSFPLLFLSKPNDFIFETTSWNPTTQHPLLTLYFFLFSIYFSFLTEYNLGRKLSWLTRID